MKVPNNWILVIKLLVGSSPPGPGSQKGDAKVLISVQEVGRRTLSGGCVLEFMDEEMSSNYLGK